MRFMELHPAMTRIPQAYWLKHFDYQTFCSFEDQFVFAEDDSIIPPVTMHSVSPEDYQRYLDEMLQERSSGH